MRLLRVASRYVAIAIVLFSVSGCAAPAVPYLAPTLDSPYVIHVCVHQPNVPKDKRWWWVTAGGTVSVVDWEMALAQAHGDSVYYFDPDAPPESAALLPIPYNKLKCPERVLSKTPLLPPKPKPKAVAKKATEEKKPPPKEEIPKAEEKRPPPQRQQQPRVASPRCETFSEPGQTRSRSGNARSCIRTRTLIKRGDPEEDAPKAITERKPPPPTMVPPKPRQYEDWGLEAPNVSGLDPERANECLSKICHARHPGFNPNGKKEGKPGEGQSWSNGSGKDAGKGPSTTVKTTRKSPLSKPKEPRLKKDGTPRQKTGPKVEDTAPHNKKVIDERNRLEAEGNKVVKGGRKPGVKEEVVKTEGGHKTRRRPDITYETPEGETRSRNVGKTNADGTPTPREQEALDDLNGPGKRPTDYVPYDR